MRSLLDLPGGGMTTSNLVWPCHVAPRISLLLRSLKGTKYVVCYLTFQISADCGTLLGTREAHYFKITEE